jgi:glutamate 5-kinase
MNHRNRLKDAKRIVVKVGTSTLTHENGAVNYAVIEKLVRTMADLCQGKGPHLNRSHSKQAILVTSGAIGVGANLLGLSKKPQSIMEKQAVAAVGQGELMHIYSKIFAEYHLKVGQILLTPHVFMEEKLRSHAVNTFETLMGMQIIPIVNENDSVATDEIEFGDNDTLSAMVAEMVKADLLILLSDVDGLYKKDPSNEGLGTLLSHVPEISAEVIDLAEEKKSRLGTGGMITKLYAGKIAMACGADMVIANGKDPGVILDILEGKEVGTFFGKIKESR